MRTPECHRQLFHPVWGRSKKARSHEESSSSELNQPAGRSWTSYCAELWRTAFCCLDRLAYGILSWWPKQMKTSNALPFPLLKIVMRIKHECACKVLHDTVVVWAPQGNRTNRIHIRMHTHIHIYVFVYIYVCVHIHACVHMCVCVCVCACV